MRAARRSPPMPRRIWAPAARAAGCSTSSGDCCRIWIRSCSARWRSNHPRDSCRTQWLAWNVRRFARAGSCGGARSAAAAAALILVTLGSLRFGRGTTRGVDTNPRLFRPPRRRLSRTARRQPLRRPQAREALPGWRLRGAAANARSTSVLDHGSRIETDVVVPAGQSRAIERYLSLVRRGALDTSALVNSDRTGVATPADLIIAPLSVEAIDVTDGESEIGPSVDRRGPRSR